MSFVICRACKSIAHAVAATAAAVGVVVAAQGVSSSSASIARFPLRVGGLHLERGAHAGAFFDVVGRRAALFGYENRQLEAWVYPIKILEDLTLSFRLEGYPRDIDGRDIVATIEVKPEATTLTYAHAAFTVRQIMVAPLDEAGVLMLLDVNSVLPLTITASFRPRLRLMWPATSMTPNTGWDPTEHTYYVTEESRKYVGMIGCPLGREDSLMPYQEEPRDVPVRMVITVPSDVAKTHFIPIAIAGSTEGRTAAKATYDRLLGSARTLYEQAADHYDQLERETIRVATPDAQLDAAFSWAKVGIDKGLATNPFLGTGLLAGFRTSGDSERPGFAWFFGRDAAWTALATNSYGDFRVTRTALEFLKKFQRADGKIPHEIAQSASLIPWFTDYEFPWNSADGTPLYVIAHGDYWRASGDKDFLRTNWDSIIKAYRFSASSDTDGNQLIENSTKTKFGHGWVEGGGLYPPHEEIYMQGLWIEASRSLAEMADALGDGALAGTARANAERTRLAMEQTYWLADRSYYAFATKRPPAEPPKADPGPNRALRQARMEELSKATIIDEDTVMPAVPLWWRTVSDDRAQLEIDHLGSGRMATDWGSRIISNESKLYDPLSYHYGAVWPLFTGWTSTGAYRYGRPHVAYQALMANALLTYTNALGYVTELLSGDFNAPFGRSSHHQVWSEAMVIMPVIRGLLGLEAGAGGKELRFEPQLPANWDRVEVRNVAVGNTHFDLKLERSAGNLTVKITRRGATPNDAKANDNITRITVAPAFPLDARVRAVKLQGRSIEFVMKSIGDIQRAEVTFNANREPIEVIYSYDEGTEVFADQETPAPGAQNKGLRILRSRADRDALHLVLEGIGGQSYGLSVRTPHQLGEVSGATVETGPIPTTRLLVAFDGPPDSYVRRELTIPLRRKSPGQ